MSDPDNRLWRLQNLYSIKDATTGRITKFRPRREQNEVFEALENGARKIIILKARRLGMSTGIDVYATDLTIFSSGIQISIVDQNQQAAAKKLENICKFAFQSLGDLFRSKFTVTEDNAKSWGICSKTGDAPSVIYADTKTRGGTNQLLHISEWGVIQAEDPKRSEEILTGALPSAEHGVIVVETTWKGGRNGHLWKLVKEAMEIPEDQRTNNDWRIFFFPWWVDPTYTEPGNVAAIPPELQTYFREMEAATGHKFTDGQKCWYKRRKDTLGVFIYREFPTTIEECFKSPIDGAIYAAEIDKLRAMNRVTAYPIDNSALVHTFWDKGSPLNTVVWYVQFVGQEIRVIDCDMSTEDAPLDLTPIQRVARMLSKGYLYGYHYLPHDCAADLSTGKTFQTELASAGLTGTRIIPRTHDVWVGINRLRQLMPRMLFRLPACKDGIDALSNYHTRTESSSGNAIDLPVHDWSSHPSDALRMMAEAEMAGMIQGGSAMATQIRRHNTPVKRSGGTRGMRR